MNILDQPSADRGDNSLSVEQILDLKAGILQQRAILAIQQLIESGRPLAECKEWLMQSLGYHLGNPDHILKLEALLIDRFALALSVEHPDIPAVLAYLEENEKEIFPEGLESYSFHLKVEGYVEAARGGNVTRYQFSDETGSARDLLAMTKYLKVLWDEEIDWLVIDDQHQVIEEIARLNLIEKPHLISLIVPFSGEKARQLRMALEGSPRITALESELRLEQLMILAIPVLANHYHLIGSLDRAQWLANNHHIPELKDAEDFLRFRGGNQVSALLGQAANGEKSLSGVPSDPSSSRATDDVFRYLRRVIPDFHRCVATALLDEQSGPSTIEPYTASDFALGMMKLIVRQGHRLGGNAYQAARGFGLYHCYIGILKAWGDSDLGKLADNLSQEEMLLAYQLLQYKPLLKHLTGLQRDNAFSGDLGL